jgi:glycine/D-amino acid oxidase-like deaminating enzyme
LADAPVRDFINGPETFTPDGHPLIGPVGGVEGLHVCTAMNSHGVTLSAAAGHMIADLIAGTDPRFDPAPYAPDRFGGQAADADWLRQEIAAAPSMSYRQSNM